ncbi:MAG: hypothetical protein KTR13_06525 [Saprospiraceae bacterium]|nr:hypothetical protein [Saprospiraceae bacterium]
MKYFFSVLCCLLLLSCKYECNILPLEKGTDLISYEQTLRNQIEKKFDNTSIRLTDTLKAQLLYIDQLNPEKNYTDEFLAKNNELINALCTHAVEKNVMGSESEAVAMYGEIMDHLVGINAGNQTCDLPVESYKPAANDKRKAVISIGANSFDGFVISVDRNKSWSNIQQYYGESLGLELGIDYALYKLEQTMESIITDQAVSAGDILVVFSSGLAEINDDAAKIKQGLESRGFRVEKLDCEAEAKYGYSANIPADYMSNSFFLDIGSGNTKLAWQNDNGIIETYCAEGSLYQQRLVSDESALASFDNLAIPESQSKYCFVTGGGPFKMAQEAGLNDTKTKYFCFPELNAFESRNFPSGQKQASYKFLNKIQELTNCEQIIFISHSNYSIGKLLELDY